MTWIAFICAVVALVCSLVAAYYAWRTARTRRWLDEHFPKKAAPLGDPWAKDFPAVSDEVLQQEYEHWNKDNAAECQERAAMLFELKAWRAMRAAQEKPA